MRILFCGDAFPGQPDYLRQRLPIAAGDELIMCHEPDIRPMLDGVDVVIPRMQRIGRREIGSRQFSPGATVRRWSRGSRCRGCPRKGIHVGERPSHGRKCQIGCRTRDYFSSLRCFAICLRLRRMSGLAFWGLRLGRCWQVAPYAFYGLGAIALPLARLLQVFGVRRIGITRNPLAAKVTEFELEQCFSIEDRARALAETDILVLCMRYTEEMRGLVGAHELSCLRPGAYLINVARGGLVDNRALEEALRHRHLAGAGLDVFWQEPLPVDDPILAFPNVIATPHIGGVTDESFSGIADSVAANIEHLRRGEPLLNQVV